MALKNSKLANLILQLHNRTNEAKEAFDQALAELELQRAENDKRYQEQLEQLINERQKSDDIFTMEKFIISASPIVNLNVGGEKMSTSRATLTLVEGSLLAAIFSGRWDEQLMRDTNGYIFLDYDPTLFKCLLNQLRTWSDPSTKRVFRLPVGSEQSFLDFVRLLKFDERYIDGETTPVISTPNIVQIEPALERFTTLNNHFVQLSGNDRTCENINGGWHCAFGTLNFSDGIHRIRVKLEKGTTDILIGICSRDKPPSGPFFYNKPTTCGWFTHGYVVTNGQTSMTGWCRSNENDIFDININCNEQSLSILNERSQAQSKILVNIKQAPFPWCLIVLFRPVGSRVSLL